VYHNSSQTLVINDGTIDGVARKKPKGWRSNNPLSIEANVS